MEEKQHAKKCEFTRRMTVDVHAQHPKENLQFCDCDGYHTFKELYEHRYALYIALCKELHCERERATREGGKVRYAKVWRSKLHSDGTMFDDSFIMGIGKDKGDQISYHFPLKMWEQTNFAETLDIAPEFDGHTPDDVLKRLKNL